MRPNTIQLQKKIPVLTELNSVAKPVALAVQANVEAFAGC